MLKFAISFLVAFLYLTTSADARLGNTLQRQNEEFGKAQASVVENKITYQSRKIFDGILYTAIDKNKKVFLESWQGDTPIIPELACEISSALLSLNAGELIDEAVYFAPKARNTKPVAVAYSQSDVTHVRFLEFENLEMAWFYTNVGIVEIVVAKKGFFKKH